MLYNTPTTKLNFGLVKEILDLTELKLWVVRTFSLSFRQSVLRGICVRLPGSQAEISEDSAVEIRCIDDDGVRNYERKKLEIQCWMEVGSSMSMRWSLNEVESHRHRSRVDGLWYYREQLEAALSKLAVSEREVCNWRKVKFWRESEFCTHNNFIIIFACCT